MRVLVTAFRPFNNQTINYSMEVLKYINNVDKLVVDVVYDNCYVEIKNKINLKDYDLIIALGEARSRDELTLEVEAHNISSCSLKDNCGVLKQNEVINELLPKILKTGVAIEKCHNLVKFSYDAGKFVCNNLYFHLLEHHLDKAIFIHIPNCHDNENEYKKYAEQIELIFNNILS
ncbi:MAG: hypothetical protein ACI311_03575 [Bacilli bacterium]